MPCPHCQAHLQDDHRQRTKKQRQKSLQVLPARLTRQNFNKTNLSHPDSFKINPKHNTDGLVNWLRRARPAKAVLGCLPQPGHIRNSSNSLCSKL